jgi:hypothetical protein
MGLIVSASINAPDSDSLFFQCGIILLPVISTTKRHRLIVWILRIAMIPVAIILFVVLIRNFYTGDPSSGMVSLTRPVLRLLTLDLQLARGVATFHVSPQRQTVAQGELVSIFI